MMDKWYLKSISLTLYIFYTVLRTEPNNLILNLNYIFYGIISCLLFYIFERKGKEEFIAQFEKISNQRFLLEEVITIPIFVISKAK